MLILLRSAKRRINGLREPKGARNPKTRRRSAKLSLLARLRTRGS